MGGQTALFAGTAIAYTAKWQITVATSSTKAEFVQAVSATKMANCPEQTGHTAVWTHNDL
eukprot:1809198-Ditylum_brightwellii.AAC.2